MSVRPPGSRYHSELSPACRVLSWALLELTRADQGVAARGSSIVLIKKGNYGSERAMSSEGRCTSSSMRENLEATGVNR